MWLDESISSDIPEFKEGELAKVTVRHLATHSSGLLGGDIDFYSCWRDQRPGEALFNDLERYSLDLESTLLC